MNLLDYLESRSLEACSQEELLYEYVASEIERGQLSKGIWTKALAETDFDQNRAKALYIKMRVASLQAELKQLAPQEALENLRNPIKADEYAVKYRKSRKAIDHAISVGALRGCIVSGVLWVEDRAP